jgi:voltage-gated potassium channel
LRIQLLDIGHPIPMPGNNDRNAPSTQLQQRAWEIVEAAHGHDTTSRAFDIGLIVLIFLNVVAMVFGTVGWVHERYGRALEWFEIFSVGIFTVEYAARVWSCVADPRYRGRVGGRIRFALSPMAVIDLLAILPSFLTFTALDLRSLRVLRLFRIFRLAKLGRYSSSLQLIGKVFLNKKEELIITGMVLAMLVVMAASLIYFAENDAQPEKFPDIPTTMWWAVVTLTTVGYGDVYPVTAAGRLFASLIAVLGIGMVALPAGIIGSSFVEELQKRKRSRQSHCPHCGKELRESRAGEGSEPHSDDELG